MTAQADIARLNTPVEASNDRSGASTSISTRDLSPAPTRTIPVRRVLLEAVGLTTRIRSRSQRGVSFPSRRQAIPHVRTVRLERIRMCESYGFVSSESACADDQSARASYQPATRCCVVAQTASINSGRVPENGVFSQRPV